MSQSASTETIESIGERHTVNGAVYFFHSPLMTLTKIGFSQQPAVRFRDIGAHVPDLRSVACVCTHDPRWLERLFHVAFAHKRQHGEWFALSEADLRVVDSLPDYASDISQLPFPIRFRVAITPDPSVLREFSPRAAGVLDVLLCLLADAASCPLEVAAQEHLGPLLRLECDRLLTRCDLDTQRLVGAHLDALFAEPPHAQSPDRDAA